MRKLFALTCCLCLPALAAPRATVELLAQSSVSGESVSLGEVAHLRSPDLELMRRLVHLPIGRAPRGDQPAMVSREALASWVRLQAGVSDEEVEWRGAQAARVMRITRQVRGEEIAAAATAALREWLAAQGVHADIQPRQLPRDLEAPAGDVRLQARPLLHAALRSRMLVWVDVWSAGAFLRTVAVSLEAGGIATETGTHGDAAPLQQPSPGHAAPGAALAVTRGAWATLRSTSGVVTLESQVEVLQDGRAGQRVRVRQAGASGVVFARVVGPAQLELVP